MVASALENLVPHSHVHGTQLLYDAEGRVEPIVRVNAGFGKVALLDDLQAEPQLGPGRIVYVGDGGSDIHVMLHTNRRDGFTIAVSDGRQIAPIAKRTVLSDDSLNILIPIVEEIAGWDTSRIRSFFEKQGLLIQDWEKARTDWLVIGSTPPQPEPSEKRLTNTA